MTLEPFCRSVSQPRTARDSKSAGHGLFNRFEIAMTPAGISAAARWRRFIDMQAPLGY
jgi:hypothetical protein